MNEEHDPKSQNPGTASFAVSIGDKQRRGDHVLGVPPSMADVPVGIAPPEPLLVVSVFDTRPISAYDFVFSDRGELDQGDAAVVVLLEADVPPGYTAVLRKLRLEFTPPASVNLDTSTANTFTAQLTRNGSPIPHNVLQLSGDLTTFEWLTHQVFGAGDVLGVRIVSGLVFPIGQTVLVNCNFHGVLIPTKSNPPETEIASPPLLVRELQDWKNEVMTK